MVRPTTDSPTKNTSRVAGATKTYEETLRQTEHKVGVVPKAHTLSPKESECSSVLGKIPNSLDTDRELCRGFRGLAKAILLRRRTTGDGQK